jgi:hypothetical protein
MLLLALALLPQAIVFTTIDMACIIPGMLLHWHTTVCSDRMASHKAKTIPHYQKQSS